MHQNRLYFRPSILSLSHKPWETSKSMLLKHGFQLKGFYMIMSISRLLYHLNIRMHWFILFVCCVSYAEEILPSCVKAGSCQIWISACIPRADVTIQLNVSWISICLLMKACNSKNK